MPEVYKRYKKYHDLIESAGIPIGQIFPGKRSKVFEQKGPHALGVM